MEFGGGGKKGETSLEEIDKSEGFIKNKIKRMIKSSNGRYTKVFPATSAIEYSKTAA